MPSYLYNKNGGLKSRVEQRIRSARRILLLLDFDGTLAPIRRTPPVAALPQGTRELLRRLVRRASITVGLVTGRSHSDIVRKVRLHGLILITNHGFQISLGGRHWVHPAAERAEPLLRDMAKTLGRALEPVRNVLIENKEFTLSVHYRNVLVKDVPLVKRLVGRFYRSYKNQLKLTTGKKVIEIRPRATWNKGYAVLRIMKSVGYTKSQCVVYFGDDTTDEDVFRVLPFPAVTVRVGRYPTSAAAFWVPNTSHVRKFLEVVDSLNSRDPVR